jgi:ABC-type glycerol-3-phosphate transport system permease component
MSRPALLMVALFSFMAHWEEFLSPLIYLNTQEKFPVSLGIANFIGVQQADFALTMAGAVLALAPPVVLFVVAQRWFIQGIVISGLKG